jgi:hypothetical protein
MLSDRDKKMSDHVVNWREQIGVIAGEFLPTDTKESWLDRAYKQVVKINPKLSFRHFSDLFYGRVPDPKYSIASSVLTAADQARIEEARRDAARLANIYQNTAHALGNIDPDIHRDHIDALVNAARILGSLDSAGIKGVK